MPRAHERARRRLSGLCVECWTPSDSACCPACTHREKVRAGTAAGGYTSGSPVGWTRVVDARRPRPMPRGEVLFVCRRGRPPAPPPDAERVSHPAFGAGHVMARRGTKLDILFDDGQQRTLLAAYVEVVS